MKLPIEIKPNRCECFYSVVCAAYRFYHYHSQFDSPTRCGDMVLARMELEKWIALYKRCGHARVEIKI